MKTKHLRPSLCVLMETFYPVIHGATVQLLTLGERFVDRGVSVTLITRQIHKHHSTYERVNGLDVFRVRPALGLKRIGKYLMLAPGLITLIKERKRYDKIIVCDLKVLGILGVIASKLLKKKCYLRAESCGEMDGTFATQYAGPPSFSKSLIIKILTSLRNRLLLKCDGFLSISSPITKELLAARVPYKSIAEIANGIDVVRFSPVDQKTKIFLRARLGLINKKHFIYTGRLARGKGLEHLLRVWKRLTAKFAKIHLLLLGSGQGFSLSCEDELKSYVIENKLDSTVTFTGTVDNVKEYLQAGDFYVLPSQTEGLSISLLEALSCGLPCITTSVGGNLDIIEHNVNGILVPYGDGDSLYQAMKDLLTDSDRAARLAYEGRNTVLQKFNIDQITLQYLSLFATP